MRAYFFGNMYLSSIQQGIQAQHTTSELFIKNREIDLYEYTKETGDNPPKSLVDSAKKTELLYEWAREHKTSILLNGVFSSTLRELIARFNTKHNPYPWTYFCEDEDAIGPLVPTTDGSGGALTCVGIILPEKIYETAKALREGNIAAEQLPVRGEWSPEEGVTWELSKWEYEFCLELNNFGMAS